MWHKGEDRQEDDMSEETPKLVIASSDRIMSRAVGAEGTPTTDAWQISSPVPGVRIINTWQIYNNIWLVLAVTESGHYCIYRTLDRQRYSLVHDHASKIYNIFYVDDGHALFCAEDGWWATTDTGVTWTETIDDLCMEVQAPAMSIIALGAGTWKLIAYGLDHKIYSRDYPVGDWGEVYDTNPMWAGKWYPAIAGCSVGILAGAGNQLLRSDLIGESRSWTAIQELGGIIKDIVISNQSNLPVFLIIVTPVGGDEPDKVYMSYDVGDSLIPDASRAGLVASAQAVTPTGTSELQTTFAVLGRRTPDGHQSVRLIQEGQT
jgi:hypothetical protein